MFSQKNQQYINHVSKLEKAEIEKLFARVFKTDEGQKILAYLQLITLNRVLHSDVPNDSLRYAEGERSIVAKIIRLTNNT